MKDKRIDVQGVIERFGVRPDQIVDFLALMGDASDNIPGVNGIGEKTATELIRQFGTLDGLYERVGEIKQQKRKETLLAEKEIAYLSRELATVHKEVPITFNWKEFDYSGPIPDKTLAFCEEFEFQNMLKRFDLKPTEEKGFKKGKYEMIVDPKRLKEVVAQLRKCPIVAIDTETTSLSIHNANLVGVSLGGIEGEGYYVPVGHHMPTEPNVRVPEQMDELQAKEILEDLVEDPSVAKVGQHLKYDLQILRRWGVELKGISSDTLIASYLIDPDQPHNLDSLAFRYLGHQNITYEEVAGSGRSQISFAEVPLDKATEYSGEDADVTLRIHQKLIPELEDQKMIPLYREVEIPLIQVLADMEYRGVLVDEAGLKKMSSGLAEEIDQVQNKIHELAGEPVNINSPKQLSHILFEKLKLPVGRKTKTGLSTDESVLLQLSESHEICKWILRSRELLKLRSTYVEGLLCADSPQTKRVHTSYNQTITSTGRLSSSNPNLQNIPAVAEAKYDVRAAFTATPGFWLLSSDYSQVELRLLADMSGDPRCSRRSLKIRTFMSLPRALFLASRRDSR